MPIVQALLGAVILFFGHRLFWLLVAIVGFLYGAQVVPRFFDLQSEMTVLLVAVGAGLVCALLAIFMQKLAVAVVGFLLASGLVLQFGGQESLLEAHVVLFVVAVFIGALGALLAVMVFDWALIILSALYGALVLTASFGLVSPWDQVVWIALAAVGAAFQIGLRHYGSRPSTRREEVAAR